MGQDPRNQGGEPELFARVDRLTRAGHGTALATSQIAIGEAFAEIVSDPAKFVPVDPHFGPSQRLQELVSQDRLGICWAGHHGRGGGRRMLELAAKVMSAAPGVGAADALIVACAIACPTNTRLFTTDAPLIRNRDLRGLCQKIRKNWEIAEAP